MLNNAWKSTCRVLFGEEIGELKDFDPFLKEYAQPQVYAKSSISGKEVVATKGFPSSAKFISHDEIPEYEERMASKSFDINEIKDIDSLLNAVKERAYYSGNTVLGNCREVSRTNKALDSFYVDDCEMVFRGKYIYKSEMVRDCEYIFGSANVAEDKFQIRTCETWKNQRVFEALRTYTSSDCYYTANVESSQNCIFSFNLRNKRNCIGNLELAFDRYIGLKKKLIAEMAQELKDRKSIASIIDIINGESYE